MNITERPVIVFAEDNPDICKLVEIQLTRDGFDIYIADNGETALELIVEHQPVIALLDIMMPKLSGFEVARKIRETPALSAVGIMLLSGRSADRVEADLVGLDIADYITKPYKAADLVQRINKVINREKPDH